jgi:thiamine-phosphate pyrophosphorylase
VHLRDDGALDVRSVRAELGAAAIVAASTHSAADAAAQLAAGADWVTLGPVWPTPSKPAAAGLGLGAFGGFARGAAVLALGGVERPARAAEAVRAGARGVAVIRAVLAAADPGAAAAAIVDAMERARG